MGQKTNPISLRLHKTNRDYESTWYSHIRYATLFSQDLAMRYYLGAVFHQLQSSQARCFFQYTHKKILAYPFLFNPIESRKKQAKLLGLTPFSRQGKKMGKGLTHSDRADRQTASSFIREQQKKGTSTSAISTNFCFFRNLQNANSKKVNFIFYLLHTFGVSSASLTKQKKQTKQPFSFLSSPTVLPSILSRKKKVHEKTFLVKQNWLANRLNKLSVSANLPNLPWFIHSFAVSEAAPAKKRVLLSKQQKKVFITKKQLYVSFFLAKVISWWRQSLQETFVSKKKSLLAQFFFFCFLDKKAGALLSTAFLENTYVSGLEATNFQKYRQTKKSHEKTQKSLTSFFDAKLVSPTFIATKEKNTEKGRDSRKLSALFLPTPLRVPGNFSSKGEELRQSQSDRQHKAKKGDSPLVLKDTLYRKHIESFISQQTGFSIELIPFQVFSESSSAVFLAHEIVYYLERRVSFHRLKSRLFSKFAQKKGVKGVRIACSGRLGGKSKKAQRSKTECVKLGQTSLHVFSSKIDFAFQSALTSFGKLGVKVWVCYT